MVLSIPGHFETGNKNQSPKKNIVQGVALAKKLFLKSGYTLKNNHWSINSTPKKIIFFIHRKNIRLLTIDCWSVSMSFSLLLLVFFKYPTEHVQDDIWKKKFKCILLLLLADMATPGSLYWSQVSNVVVGFLSKHWTNWTADIFPWFIIIIHTKWMNKWCFFFLWIAILNFLEYTKNNNNDGGQTKKKRTTTETSTILNKQRRIEEEEPNQKIIDAKKTE